MLILISSPNSLCGAYPHPLFDCHPPQIIPLQWKQMLRTQIALTCINANSLLNLSAYDISSQLTIAYRFSSLEYRFETEVYHGCTFFELGLRRLFLSRIWKKKTWCLYDAFPRKTLFWVLLCVRHFLKVSIITLLCLHHCSKRVISSLLFYTRDSFMSWQLIRDVIWIFLIHFCQMHIHRNESLCDWWKRVNYGAFHKMGWKS